MFFMDISYKEQVGLLKWQNCYHGYCIHSILPHKSVIFGYLSVNFNLQSANFWLIYCILSSMQMEEKLW